MDKQPLAFDVLGALFAMRSEFARSVGCVAHLPFASLGSATAEDFAEAVKRSRGVSGFPASEVAVKERAAGGQIPAAPNSACGPCGEDRTDATPLRSEEAPPDEI